MYLQYKTWQICESIFRKIKDIRTFPEKLASTKGISHSLMSVNIEILLRAHHSTLLETWLLKSIVTPFLHLSSTLFHISPILKICLIHHPYPNSLQPYKPPNPTVFPISHPYSPIPCISPTLFIHTAYSQLHPYHSRQKGSMQLLKNLPLVRNHQLPLKVISHVKIFRT